MLFVPDVSKICIPFDFFSTRTFELSRWNAREIEARV